MENYYEFDHITNNREIEDLKETFGEALQVFNPEFLEVTIPPDYAFIESQKDIGIEHEDAPEGARRRIMTITVGLDAVPSGDGAIHVLKLLSHLGYMRYKQYILSYWTSEIPYKIRVQLSIRKP